LQGIKDDEIFGFIRCDVTSPDAMINKHLKNGFLFPPVITKQIIEDDMLSPFMKEQNDKRPLKQKDASPIQTYHGSNVFLFTPLVKLYMEMGMKISNVTEVIQYYPGKCFLPFADRVVQLRSEATRDGDDAKQLTAKLFGNSGKLYVLLFILSIFVRDVQNGHLSILSIFGHFVQFWTFCPFSIHLSRMNTCPFCQFLSIFGHFIRFLFICSE